jgi:hypothetical protein
VKVSRPEPRENGAYIHYIHVYVFLLHFMLKSVDTVGSMVVSATFVCRIRPYADETLIKFD